LNKGFIFSFEAAISMLLFGLMITMIFPMQAVSLKELIILQQENDLLKLWSINYPSQNEMEIDAKQLFSDTELFVNNNNVFFTGNKKDNSVSSEAIIFDNYLNETKVRVVVYFD